MEGQCGLLPWHSIALPRESRGAAGGLGEWRLQWEGERGGGLCGEQLLSYGSLH